MQANYTNISHGQFRVNSHFKLHVEPLLHKPNQNYNRTHISHNLVLLIKAYTEQILLSNFNFLIASSVVENHIPLIMGG